MNKIALCLTGQPRNFQSGFNNLKETILTDEVDVHFHAWWHEDDVNKKYATTPHSGFIYQYYNLPGADENLIKLYNPKTYQFEKSITFDMPRKYNMHAPQTNIYARYSAMAQKFYSIQSALSKIKQYEIENNFEYDWVLITRYDISLNHKIQSVFYDETLNEGIYLGNRPGSYVLFSDNLWLLSNKFRYEFINLYENIDKNIKIIEELNDEDIIKIQSKFTEDMKYKTSDLFDQREIHGEGMLAWQLILNDSFVKIRELDILSHNIIR